MSHHFSKLAGRDGIMTKLFGWMEGGKRDDDYFCSVCFLKVFHNCQLKTETQIPPCFLLCFNLTIGLNLKIIF